MSDFINQQIISFLNQRFGKIGEVSDVQFSGGNVSITIALAGEPEIVTLEVHNLSWNTAGGKMNLYYEELNATKLWIQEVFCVISEKTGKTISFPDSLKLMPLKMMLPKKR